MIPPVEERQVRPCRGCVLHGYAMDNTETCKAFGKIERLKHTGECLGNGDLQYLKTNPCKHNLRMHELTELIDSGVVR